MCVLELNTPMYTCWFYIQRYSWCKKYPVEKFKKKEYLKNKQLKTLCDALKLYISKHGWLKKFYL